MFQNFSLKAKLIGLTSFLAFLTGILGWISYNNMQGIVAAYSHVMTQDLPKTKLLLNIKIDLKDIVIGVANLMGTHASSSDILEAKNIYGDALRKYNDSNSKFESLPKTPNEEVMWNEVKSTWDNMSSMALKLIQLSATGRKEDEDFRDGAGKRQFSDLRKVLREKIDKAVEHQAKDGEEWSNKSKSLAQSGMQTVLFLSLVGMGLSLCLGYFFSSALAKSLQYLAAQLSEGAAKVATAASQISEASNNLASSATQQASSLQETVSSIDEVNAMVSKNAENAKRSQELSVTTRHAATNGKETVDLMLLSIDEIARSNNDIMKQTTESNIEISNIVKVIAEIGNKTKVINDIVFQTKLLSFNASVEAARAGEHGKGFAVVAEEVGNLAQMSGNAAREISHMLDESINNVERIVQDSKARIESLIVVSKEKIETGVSTGKRCGITLENIVKNVGELNQMISEIATASQEQALGVQEITKAMEELDKVTQLNSSASQQSAAAADELKNQAVVTDRIVLQLLKTIYGAAKQILNNSRQEFTPTYQHQNENARPQHSQASHLAHRTQVAHVKNNTHAKNQNTQNRAQMKMASGSENVPFQNDSRFEDV